MRSLWRCCARARIDTALAGDRVAPFITNKVLNEVDDDVRQLWVRMPTGWNYQMTLARVVADLTGAGALSCNWQTEKIGDLASSHLRRHAAKIKQIKKNQKGERKAQLIREQEETCYFDE